MIRDDVSGADLLIDGRAGNAGEVPSEKPDRNPAMRELALESLLGLIGRLGTTLDLDTVVRLLLMTVSGQLSLFQAACYLAESPGGKHVFVHSLGIGAGSLPESMSRSGDIVVNLERCRSLFVLGRDCGTEGENAGQSEEGLLVSNGFNYAFPLVDGGEMLGLLLLSKRIRHEGFDDFSTEILHMISRVATMAIRNAMLYRDLLESKMEIEDFSRVKMAFLNHTSHELRTPLTILKSSIWSMETEEGHDRMLVDMAKNAVDRLNGLVEQVLSFNEIGLNDSSLEIERVNIMPLLESCLGERLMDLGSMGVTFKLDKPPAPIQIDVDQVKMKIVFKNLIDNAISSVEQGGNIFLSVSRRNTEPGDSDGVELTGWHKSGGYRRFEAKAVRTDGLSTENGGMKTGCAGGFLVVRIKDDGIGIPTDEIGKISEPFIRASNSKMADVRGMGLGLSVAQKIIAAHGARLFCRSARGAGAEFSIWFRI